MAGVILGTPVGASKIASPDERQAIYEAEKAAAAFGVLPDDKEKRDAIINRLRARLARAGLGWGVNAEETVVRVDDQGVAHIIPKDRAVGFIRGLPAAPDSRDASSGSARVGRTTPHRETHIFADPGPITPADPREAAQRFYLRIRSAIEQYGTIPASLQQELWAEGWKLGQPLPWDKVQTWCAEYTARVARQYG